MSYSRSQWSSLSIQDRIRAMNENLDHVEEAVEPVESLDMSEDQTATSSSSSSLQYQASTFPSESVPTSTFSQDTVEEATAPPKRSSVVDIWRQREGEDSSAAAVNSKALTGNSGALNCLPTKKSADFSKTQAWSGESTLAPAPTSSMTTSPSAEVKQPEDEQDEKKESDQEETATSVRNMWQKRASPIKSPMSYVSPAKSKDGLFKRPTPIQPLLNKPKVQTTDLTIVPSESEEVPTPTTQRKSSNSPLAVIPSIKSPSEAVLAKESPSKRSSVLDFWKTRTSSSPAKSPVEQMKSEPQASPRDNKNTVLNRWAQLRDQSEIGDDELEEASVSTNGVNLAQSTSVGEDSMAVESQASGHGIVNPWKQQRNADLSNSAYSGKSPNPRGGGVANRWKEQREEDISAGSVDGPIHEFKSPSKQNPNPSESRGVVNRWKQQRDEDVSHSTIEEEGSVAETESSRAQESPNPTRAPSHRSASPSVLSRWKVAQIDEDEDQPVPDDEQKRQSESSGSSNWWKGTDRVSTLSPQPGSVKGRWPHNRTEDPSDSESAAGHSPNKPVAENLENSPQPPTPRTSVKGRWQQRLQEDSGNAAGEEQQAGRSVVSRWAKRKSDASDLDGGSAPVKGRWTPPNKSGQNLIADKQLQVENEASTSDNHSASDYGASAVEEEAVNNPWKQHWRTKTKPIERNVEKNTSETDRDDEALAVEPANGKPAVACSPTPEWRKRPSGVPPISPKPSGLASPGRLSGRWTPGNGSQVDDIGHDASPSPNMRSMSPVRGTVASAWVSKFASPEKSTLKMPNLDADAPATDVTPKAKGSGGNLGTHSFGTPRGLARCSSIGSSGELSPRRFPAQAIGKKEVKEESKNSVQSTLRVLGAKKAPVSLPTPIRKGVTKQKKESASGQRHARLHSFGSLGEVAIKPYRPPTNGGSQKGPQKAEAEPQASGKANEVARSSSVSPFQSRIRQSWSCGEPAKKDTEALLSKASTKKKSAEDGNNTLPKAKAGPLLFSIASAFNTYGQTTEKRAETAEPQSKAAETIPKRKKKNLVSLGRRHIGKGLSRKPASTTTSLSVSDTDFERGSDISSTLDSNASQSSASQNDLQNLDNVGHGSSIMTRSDLPKIGAKVEGNQVAARGGSGVQTDSRFRGYESDSTPKRKTSSAADYSLPNPRRMGNTMFRAPPARTAPTEHGRNDDKPLSVKTGQDVDDHPTIDMELSMSLSVDSGCPIALESPSESVVKKKQLQEKRRRKKKGKSLEGEEFALPSPKDVRKSSRKSHESPRDESNWADGLHPIDENESARHEAIGKRSTQPSEYTTLHVSDSGSPWNPKFPMGVNTVGSPLSDDGQSEVSFFSDSAFSTISKKSSNLSTCSSLANKAERLLQARRRKKNQDPSTSEELDMAHKLTRNVMELNQSQDHSRQADRGHGGDKSFMSARSDGSRSHATDHMSQASAERRRREAGFSNRYNTSSRFIDNEISTSTSAPVTYDISTEETASADGSTSSSYRTLETASTGDSFETGQTSERGRRHDRKYRIRRSRSAAAVPAKFLDQSSDNMDSFKKAFESLGFGQIAADLAKEVSNATFDITKLAQGVNETVQSLRGDILVDCKAPIPKCDGLSPCIEEDVAIEVEYLEDSKSSETDADRDCSGSCALVEEAVIDQEDILPDGTKEPVFSDEFDTASSPAGQPSFEEAASSSYRSQSAFV